MTTFLKRIIEQLEHVHRAWAFVAAALPHGDG